MSELLFIYYLFIGLWYLLIPDLFRWIVIFIGGVIPFNSTGYTKYSQVSGLSSACIRNWHDGSWELGDVPNLSISFRHNYVVNIYIGKKWLSYQTLHGLIIGLMLHPGGGSCWKTSSMNPFSETKWKRIGTSISELSHFFLINYKIIQSAW